MKTAWRGFPDAMSTTVTNSNGSTTTYTATNDIFTVGAGQVDAWAAYNDVDYPVGTAASPSAMLYANGSVQLQLNPTDATSAIWGSSSFATSAIWGSNINGTSAIWGSSALWGSMTAIRQQRALGQLRNLGQQHAYGRGA